MYHVELYLRVRLACHRDGLSQREAARRFGIDRKTVAKILKHSVPPGYQRGQAPKRPKLDPYTGIIDQILEDDKSESKKQRHTCKRIFEWLRDEHGYSGGITIVTDYVRARKRLGKEVFVPLAHDPGHAQVDFGEAWAIIAGVKRKVHYFALDLPHSDACFVKAYPAETTEAFCDGHVAAFGFFGGIPLSILYDNTTLAVAKIKKDGKRVRTETFTKLQSHYLFQDKFARPAKGNEKGKVEGLIGYVRRNYLVPIPRFDSFDALNAWLEEQCLKRQGDQLRGRGETIEARLHAPGGLCGIWIGSTLMALPATPYDACEQVSTGAVVAADQPIPSRWCAIATMTTRCRWPMPIMRFGCGAMFTRSSSVVARRLSPATPVLMRKETWSLTRCTFCLCLNKRSVHWIRRRR